MVRHNISPETRGAFTGAATLLAIAGIAFCADQIGAHFTRGDERARPSAASEQNVILAEGRARGGTTAPVTATVVPAPAGVPDGPDAVIEDVPAQAPAPQPRPRAGGDGDGPTAPAGREGTRRTTVAAEQVSATGVARGRWRPATLPLAAPPAQPAAAPALAPPAPAVFAKQPVRLQLRSLKRVPAEAAGTPDQVELKVATLGADNLPTATRMSVRVAMPQEQAATEAGGSSLHVQLGLLESTGTLQLRVRVALSEAAVAKPVLSRAAPAELASDALHLWMPLASPPTTPPENPDDPKPPAPPVEEEVPAETPPPGALTADAPPPPDATVPVDIVANVPTAAPDAPVSQTVDLAPTAPATPEEPAPAPTVTVEVGADPEPPVESEPPVPPAPVEETLAAEPPADAALAAETGPAPEAAPAPPAE